MFASSVSRHITICGGCVIPTYRSLVTTGKPHTNIHTHDTYIYIGTYIDIRIHNVCALVMKFFHKKSNNSNQQ